MAKTAKANETNIQDTLPQSGAKKEASALVQLKAAPYGRPVADNTTPNMDEMIGYLDYITDSLLISRLNIKNVSPLC